MVNPSKWTKRFSEKTWNIIQKSGRDPKSSNGESATSWCLSDNFLGVFPNNIIRPPTLPIASWIFGWLLGCQVALGLESYKVFFLLVCWITHDRPGLKYTVKIDGAKLHTFFLEWGLNYCLQNAEDRSINQSHRIMTGYQSKMCWSEGTAHTKSRSWHMVPASKHAKKLAGFRTQWIKSIQKSSW